MYQDSTEVKQQRIKQTLNEMFPPQTKILFFCLTSSRGNLHVLLSSSVPLILPLILHCPHVKSKVHIQTDPGQQSRGHQSMKWKKKTTPLPCSPRSNPSETAQHLIKLIKWLDQLPVMVSGPHNAVERECTLTEVNPQSNSSWQNKLYNYWWHEFTQWINSRAMCAMYWAVFNYQSKPFHPALAFISSNCHHYKIAFRMFVFFLNIYFFGFLLYVLV